MDEDQPIIPGQMDVYECIKEAERGEAAESGMVSRESREPRRGAHETPGAAAPRRSNLNQLSLWTA